MCAAPRLGATADAAGYLHSTDSIPSFLRPRSAIMVDRYCKKIAAMVIQLAKDDPKFVKAMIQKLKRSGKSRRRGSLLPRTHRRQVDQDR